MALCVRPTNTPPAMPEEPKKSIWIDKSAEDLVYFLSREGEPGSRAHQEVKGALNYALTKRLCDSIDRHEKASSRLAIQVLILNVILGIFTIAGTVLTIISLMKQPS